MKKIFFICLFISAINSFAQNHNGLSETEFKKLKKLYIEMTNSDSYRAMKAQSKLIVGKINGEKLSNIETNEDFNKWITQNISKTKFSSIEEGNSMFKLMMELTEKTLNEFKEVYEKLKRTSQKQMLELLEDERSRE
ncbi:hypothetical protein [Flavobacterium sp.]|uniref:hypothetical protein n=1 Tax=Flavobacterium sp. TaxID=239 RepID=UPI0035B3FCC7